MMTNDRSTKVSIQAIIPSLYFLLLSIYWFYDSLSQMGYNYAALGVALVLVTQIALRNRLLGLSIGLFGILGSVLMFFAVFSEFNDFNRVTDSARQLLLVGVVLSLSGLVMAILMTRAYAKSLLSKQYVS